jgi:hypothetical protein
MYLFQIKFRNRQILREILIYYKCILDYGMQSVVYLIHMAATIANLLK